MLFGIILRILFIIKGGAIYYGKEDFWLMGGDTLSWMNSFLNLLNNGIYSADMAVENGKFFRPPGYSFAMGIAYLLAGKELTLTYKILIWAQTGFDVITILLIYKITLITSKNILFSNLSAFCYATYPFIIVWVPILYAESLSVFFMFLGLYYFIKEGKNWKFFWAAFYTGLAALCRLQCLPLLPLFLLAILISKSKFSILLRQASFFALGILLSYGLWPIRNYVNQNRIVFTQDVNVGGHWSQDYFSLMGFLGATQVDTEPQSSQILDGQKVTWPDVAIIDESDRVLLDSLSNLCKKCGTGVSYFRYYGRNKGQLIPPEQNCDSQIKSGFDYLTQKQKERNKLNYYVKVPAGNFKKAFFKSSLHGEKNSVIKKIVATTLFGYRSLMLILGFAGLFLAGKNNLINKDLFFIILFYVVGWYGFMCFSFRHLEMRYFLHADLLLLIPAAFSLFLLKQQITNKRNVA